MVKTPQKILTIQKQFYKMKNSEIEWTHHTLNLWMGCTKVNELCDLCYACEATKRTGFNIWGDENPRRMVISTLKSLKKFQKDAEKAGEIHRVFVGSMMDIFEKPKELIDHKKRPLLEGQDEFWNTGQLRDRFFEIVPNYPNLMFLLLTKRASNINKYIPESWKENPPKNVMFGISVGNQKTANDWIPLINKVNGQKFLSIEPQLDEIDLTVKMRGSDLRLIDVPNWIINGGESGHHRRPFDTDWGRVLRDQCKENGVPFFFKQVDKKIAIPADLEVRQFPKNHTLINNNNMKTTLKTALSKEERNSNNNTKCALALEKGYKYDRATGEIIGQRNKAIKAHINGYTIISFVVDGKRNYLYGTTFIEYILKSENESVSPEEIELAKAYVKPSASYLAIRKALKEANTKELVLDTNLKDVLLEEQEISLLSKNYPTNEKILDKGFQFRPNTFSQNYITNKL
jgi:protein gp37